MHFWFARKESTRYHSVWEKVVSISCIVLAGTPFVTKAHPRMPTPISILLLPHTRLKDVVAEALRASQYDPAFSIVASEAELIAALAESPDLVLADAAQDTFHALEILREVSPDTPLIALAPPESEQTAMELLRQGACDYVLTNCLARLEQAITRALEVKRLRQIEQISRCFTGTAITYRFHFGPRGGFKQISPTVTALTGYTPEEFYANYDLPARAVHPADLPLLQKVWEGELPPGEPADLRFTHKEGGMLWLEHRALPIRGPNGEVRAIVGMLRDVSKRKTAEEELQLSLEALEVTEEVLRRQNAELTSVQERLDAERRRYKYLFESAPDAYLITDMQGQIHESNAAASQLLGIPTGDTNGISLNTFMADPEKQTFASLLQSLGRDEARRTHTRLLMHGTTGKTFVCSVTMAVAADSNPEHKALHWILRKEPSDPV